MSSPPLTFSGTFVLNPDPVPASQTQCSLPASPSSLSPCISPPSSPSLLPSPLHASSTSFGHLHLTPSTFADYLNLPHRPGECYELIDGILYYRPDNMNDLHHKHIQSVLVSVFNVANAERPDAEWVMAYSEARVGIRRNSHAASQPSASSSRGPGGSCLIADVAVGRHFTPEDQANMSPTSKKINFPPGRPPAMVVEVTSSNRVEDLTTKVGEYARAGVPEYIVVDREKSRVIVFKLKEDKNDKKGTKSHRSSRINSAADGNAARTYQSQRYYSKDQTVEAVAFRDLKLTANDLLHPQKSSTRLIVSPLPKKDKKISKLTKERDEATKERDQARKRIQEVENENKHLQELVTQRSKQERASDGSPQPGAESGNRQKGNGSPVKEGSNRGRSGAAEKGKSQKRARSPDGGSKSRGSGSKTNSPDKKKAEKWWKKQ